ncbi:PREDICTED: double-stranded RNA-specific editase B2-like [Acropora digitifera]|uniref:double-stranded RNA-specific editase B2-like n=1 Tax=Acropora digitifera TaxID=70779 RepID=UPI00077B1D80|nr:PREDICTED: double-stranded RNA-specific editase B2-like [Acropora digitifera]
MAFNGTSDITDSEDQRAFSVMKKLRKLKGNSPDKEFCEDDFETLPSYRTRRSYAAGPLKSPLMQLNEMGKEVKYNVVSRTGPSHCPTFVVEVIVDGRAYRGKGKSKKHARQNAAERALRHLRRYLPRPSERNQISESEEENDQDDAPRMSSLRSGLASQMEKNRRLTVRLLSHSRRRRFSDSESDTDRAFNFVT